MKVNPFAIISCVLFLTLLFTVEVYRKELNKSSDCAETGTLEQALKESNLLLFRGDSLLKEASRALREQEHRIDSLNGLIDMLIKLGEAEIKWGEGEIEIYGGEVEIYNLVDSTGVPIRKS